MLFENVAHVGSFKHFLFVYLRMTQGKIDLRNKSGRPMKVKVVGEVSEK